MPASAGQSGSPSASAWIRAWTIPLRRFISGQPGYFHNTYVTSDLGDRWGCAGRDQGGRAICQGQGDVGIVRCIAGTDGRAGLFYGLTGVCHQIANRILFAAGRNTVHAARGYALTVGVYGEYGIGPWPRLMACYGSDASIGARPLADGDAGPTEGSRFPSQRDAQRRRIERSIMLDGDFQDRAQSLEKLIVGQSEAAVPAETVQRVIDQHRGFWGYQRHLVEALVAEEIDRSQYLESFNSGLSALMSADKRILGDRAYTAIFGPTFDGADSMIDAETFLAGEPVDGIDAEPHHGPEPW